MVRRMKSRLAIKAVAHPTGLLEQRRCFDQNLRASGQRKSGLIVSLRSIQPGVGRFFERKNSGLKSFD